MLPLLSSLNRGGDRLGLSMPGMVVDDPGMWGPHGALDEGGGGTEPRGQESTRIRRMPPGFGCHEQVR